MASVQNDLKKIDPAVEDRDEDVSLLLSEEFDSRELRELATILLGMGLKKEEILLFTKRNMSLEKFLKLTDEDLQHVGITDCNKRKDLLYGIHSLTANKESKQPKELVIREQLSHEEFLTILSNSTIHLNTMCKAMPYIERKLEEVGLNQFLHNSISARHTLAEVAEKGVVQVEQLRRQLEALKLQVQKYRKQTKKKRIKNSHLVAILVTATTICCVLMWKTRPIS